MSKNALYLSAGKVEKIILIPDPQKRSVPKSSLLIDCPKLYNCKNFVNTQP